MENISPESRRLCFIFVIQGNRHLVGRQHLERLQAVGQQEFLLTVDPVLPGNYFSIDFDQKLEYQINTYLKQSISWIDAWVTFIDQADEDTRYMISSFEEFIRDPHAFYSRLFDFFHSGLSDVISTPVAAKEIDKNFRSGLTNEWETVFSPTHLGMASEIIPAELIDRFKWKM
jgi:hypothetical protein